MATTRGFGSGASLTHSRLACRSTTHTMGHQHRLLAAHHHSGATVPVPSRRCPAIRWTAACSRDSELPHGQEHYRGLQDAGFHLRDLAGISTLIGRALANRTRKEFSSEGVRVRSGPYPLLLNVERGGRKPKWSRI